MEDYKLLIVDDEMPTLKGIHRVLNKWSQGRYEILTAENGEEAMELIKLHGDSILLMVSDIRMPKRDGLSLLKWMNRKGSRTLTILLTGHAEFEYAREALRNGASNYLLKPVSESVLLTEVEQTLQRVEQERSDRAKIQMADQHPELFRDELVVSNPFIQEAITYVKLHLNTPLTALKVADNIHLNSSYFSVLFKEETGLTFTDFITKERFRKAKELLLCTDLKMYEITEQIGYQTASHFVKVFQEQEGVTPKKFRERYK